VFQFPFKLYQSSTNWPSHITLHQLTNRSRVTSRWISRQKVSLWPHVAWADMWSPSGVTLRQQTDNLCRAIKRTLGEDFKHYLLGNQKPTNTTSDCDERWQR